MDSASATGSKLSMVVGAIDQQRSDFSKLKAQELVVAQGKDDVVLCRRVSGIQICGMRSSIATFVEMWWGACAGWLARVGGW